MDEPFWTNQKFAIVGLALAFLGVAVGIGQWVMPVDQLGGEIKLGLNARINAIVRPAV